MKTHGARMWVAWATLASLVVAFRPTPSDAQGTREGCGSEVVLATNGDSQSVNPLYGSDTGTVWRTDQISESLVYLDHQTLRPVPRLARSWDVSADGTTYTFHLREGPKWSDGRPLTAEDFNFTLHTILSADYTGPWRALYKDIVGAERYRTGQAQRVDGVRVIDEKTLQIKLQSPNATFLTEAARNLKPVSRLLRGQKLGPEHPFMQKPEGVGPYRLVEWVKDDHLTLEAKPDYWGDPVCARRITDRYITDMNALALALESGRVDQIAPVAPRDLLRMRNNSDIKIHQPQASRMDAIYFNLRHKDLANVKVRQAIAMTLNLREFTQGVLAGIQNPVVGPVLPSSWAYDPEIRAPAQDLERAKALLTEAGYRDGFNITIGANAGNTTREQMATFLQGQLSKIGIRAKVEFTEWSTFITSVTDGRFEIVVLSSFAGVPDPDSLYADYHTQGATNYGKYSNPQVDRMLEQARATLNQDQRKRLYLQVERLLVQDLPRIWAYDYLSAFATRASISNVRPSVLGSTWDTKFWRKSR